ncbi:MAG TPA: tRNA (N6-isopentenyl adenosine(37)-C2)-methylthiotransferase MiaB [Pyrinomonadaceae bacterium]|jgi:tRNA-2-methylthio-N6-dimethylallyladenosine synthase
MKKVYLETFGCQMNVSDSERVATLLESEGFEMTSNENSADVVLLNTCSVREKAEHKLYTRVGQIRNSKDKKTVVGVLGCVAQLEGETLFKKADGIDFVLGTKAVGRVTNAIEKAFERQGPFVDLGEREEFYDWSVSDAQRHSSYVAFLPIIEGCNKFCTYCIVPFSRGREKSLAPGEIIRQILELKHRGFKEVHLIGQNVNSYRPKIDAGLESFPGATPFSRLLRAAAATGMERIKFTTSFPRDFHTDIVDAIDENENLCNWVHLPVQSGSNQILKAMRRGHTIESYMEKIDKIKASPRKLSLSTDIIIGFPGETIKDFEDTKKIVEYCQFDSAYIFKYSPRPGTPAAALDDDVSREEKTDRFLELERVQRYHQNKVSQTYLGETVKVLVEKKAVKGETEFSGHSSCQKVVNFKADSELLGKIVDVRITECKSNTLFGVIC